MGKKRASISRRLSDYLIDSDFMNEEKIIELVHRLVLNQIGEINNLATNDKSLIINAINELVNDINNIENEYTKVSNLMSTVKSKLVNKLDEKNVIVLPNDSWETIINCINELELYPTKTENIFEFTVKANDTVVLKNDLRGDSVAIDTDWGDGTINNSLTHTYTKAGVYRVITRYSINAVDGSGDSTTRNLLTDVIDINKSINNASNMFYNCKNLTVVVADEWNTSNITNMSYMFNGCENLIAIYMDDCDVSKVTQIKGMFDGTNLFM